MKRYASIACACAASALAATAQIADQQVKADFEARKAAVGDPACFQVFDLQLDPDTRECLEFLYAYMPLPDLTDNPGDYFLANVETALRAREEMPWGKTVPDREFRHFVLPVRVNNEDLDEHRMRLYDTLKERVAGLDMAQAILEVNHWCHEYVTYQPSDSRTHAPLASMSSAIGRCGEESTFTVAALRAIGIPARQVYTPRWAHTDDNHAWVEAWADGTWHFLGACEPEPVLDLGWFNAPASRGMLMNTRTPGLYDGPEEKLLITRDYTDINVTDNYAKVDTITVAVVGPDGKPLPGARVDFRLYNYAEFYPLASKTADSLGKASLVAGLGNLVVWASDGENYAYRMVMVGKDKEITIALPDPAPQPAVTDINITPPAGAPNLPWVSPEMAAANDARKAREDSIRTAYMATFMTQPQAMAIAERLELPADRLWPVMKAARGNYAEIASFLMAVPQDVRMRALLLLENLSTKDLSDVTGDVLRDAMTVEPGESQFYGANVLSPRIWNEFLVPHRAELAACLSEAQRQQFRHDPASLAIWVGDSISADAKWTPSSVRMAPLTIMRHRRADVSSREIFFVALARSIGIPSRIDPVTGKPQYCDADGHWQDVLQAGLADASQAHPKGSLAIAYDKQGYIADPTYYTHFTISKIENGLPQLLNFPDDATWSQICAEPLVLDAGQYMLISGQRLANGGVLARVQTLEIKPGEQTDATLSLRQDSEGVKVIGSFNSEDLYYDIKAGAEKSLLSTTGRGYYVLGLLKPKHEPSIHALRDIAAMRQELEEAGVKMVLIYPEADDAIDLNLDIELPATAVIGADPSGAISAEVVEAMRLVPGDLPIFIIADTFNRVVFVTQGYTIGLGHQLLDTLRKL